MNNHPSQEQLLQRVNEVSFAALEMNMYLDTHPEDEKARESFAAYTKLRLDALEDYAKCYGPLTPEQAARDVRGSFKWIDQPWPWEGKKGGCR